MSHANKKSLKLQSLERMKPMLCLGRSKFDDKRSAAKAYDARYGILKKYGIKPPVGKAEYVNEALRGRIYSISTFRNYVRCINRFLDYCKKEHRCRTLDQCREYAPEWLQKRSESRLSAYTIKLECAALAKLYGVCGREFGVSVSRRREDIKRSRGDAIRDKDFSVENNAELIQFCKATGLRRSELKMLRPEQLEYIDGKPHLCIKGKGGRIRKALIIGDVDAVVKRFEGTNSEARVWERIPSHMDVHACRAQYASDLYKMVARDVSVLPRRERYYCRGDKKGAVYDRRAMEMVSQALGHSRINVIAAHYMYGLGKS